MADDTVPGGSEMPLLLNAHHPDDDGGMPAWFKVVMPLIAAAVVAYFTSEIRSEAAMSRMEEREQNHYLELRASIELLRQDLRDYRRESNGNGNGSR